jgi:WD40 repeat protein
MGSKPSKQTEASINRPQVVHEVIRTPHTASLDCISLSHDDQLIAVGSFDGTVSIYDVNTLQLIYHLKQFRRSVASVCFSHDDKLLARGAEGSIVIFNLSKGTAIHHLKKHSQSIHLLAFSSDDRLLVSGSPDKIVIWNVVTGKAISEIIIKERWRISVCFSNADNYVWNHILDFSASPPVPWRLYEVMTTKRLSGATHVVPPPAISQVDKKRGKSSDGRFEYSLKNIYPGGSPHLHEVHLDFFDSLKKQESESKRAESQTVGIFRIFF